MDRIINVRVEKLPEGVWLATSDQVQGLVAQGRTVVEALEIARDVVHRLMEHSGTRRRRIRPDRRRRGRLRSRHRRLMAPLAGFPYPYVARRLRRLGFRFDRRAAGSHEIWFDPETARYTTIPNHLGDLPQGTLRAISAQAGVSLSAFLAGP